MNKFWTVSEFDVGRILGNPDYIVHIDKILDKIRKWALANVNCTHSACSMAESVWEEVHGKQILDILNKEKTIK